MPPQRASGAHGAFGNGGTRTRKPKRERLQRSEKCETSKGGRKMNEQKWAGLVVLYGCWLRQKGGWHGGSGGGGGGGRENV
ncbi:hypothetical protein C8F04DRAFT_1236898, partial [Mycena alexandri]